MCHRFFHFNRLSLVQRQRLSLTEFLHHLNWVLLKRLAEQLLLILDLLNLALLLLGDLNHFFFRHPEQLAHILQLILRNQVLLKLLELVSLLQELLLFDQLLFHFLVFFLVSEHLLVLAEIVDTFSNNDLSLGLEFLLRVEQRVLSK